MMRRLSGAALFAVAAALMIAPGAANAQVDPAGCTDDLQYDASIPTYHERPGPPAGRPGHGRRSPAGRRPTCSATSTRWPRPPRTTRACG